MVKTLKKKTPEKKKRVLWASDGVNGGSSSLQILLDWITTEGNYGKWKGGDEHSVLTKETSKLTDTLDPI